jgi:hypothetical protein
MNKVSTHIRKAILTIGFPDELPEEIATVVNELALRELAGEPVPCQIATWTDADGGRQRLVWQPQAVYHATLPRLTHGGARSGAA